MALSAEQIADLVISTTSDFRKKDGYTQVAQRLQTYEAMPRILKRGRVKFVTSHTVERRVMVRDSGAAEHIPMFATDNVNVVDLMEKKTVPVRHTQTHWAYDVKEQAFQGGEEQIYDLIQSRRLGSMLSLADKLETTWWSKPVDSTDNITPWGVYNWIVKAQSDDAGTLATAGNCEGFLGRFPAGFTTGAGGLLHANWRNYTNDYVTVSKTDLIKKWRKAYHEINFKAPVSAKGAKVPEMSDMSWYCNYDTIANIEDLGEAQNENLGRDLASMDGMMTFRRTPLTVISQLDSDTSNPIIGINWGAFGVMFLKGQYFREDNPVRSSSSHDVFNNFVNLSWNTDCDNRRAQAILYIA